MDAQKTQYLIAHLVAETTAPAAKGQLFGNERRRLTSVGAALMLLGGVAAAAVILRVALILLAA